MRALCISPPFAIPSSILHGDAAILVTFDLREWPQIKVYLNGCIPRSICLMYWRRVVTCVEHALVIDLFNTHMACVAVCFNAIAGMILQLVRYVYINAMQRHAMCPCACTVHGSCNISLCMQYIIVHATCRCTCDMQVCTQYIAVHTRCKGPCNRCPLACYSSSSVHSDYTNTRYFVEDKTWFYQIHK